MAETSIACPVCDEPIRVKLTFGEGDETGFPVSLRRSDVEAAWLAHALEQGVPHVGHD